LATGAAGLRTAKQPGDVGWHVGSDVDFGHDDQRALGPRGGTALDCLVVRITTTAKPPDEPTVVRLTSEDQLAGWVLCDDVTSAYRDELTDAGALTRATMERVSDGLRAALAL
jgi:mRNA-degrading endonuclease toxin of MazEF toxin-antitoxin module